MKKYLIFYIFLFALCSSPQAEDLYGSSDEVFQETSSTVTTISTTTTSTTVIEKGFNDKDFRNIPIVSVSWEEDNIDLSSAKNIYEDEIFEDSGTFLFYENVSIPIYVKTPPWVDCNWMKDNYVIAVAPWSRDALFSLKYPTYSFSITVSPNFECSDSTNEIIFDTWRIFKDDVLKIDEINLQGGFIFWENGNSGLQILPEYFDILPNQNNLEIIYATPFVCPPGNLTGTSWSWPSLRIDSLSVLYDKEINCTYNKFFMRYIGKLDSCPTTTDLIIENSETSLKIIESINSLEGGREINESSCVWYDIRENNFFTFDMPMFKSAYAINLISS